MKAVIDIGGTNTRIGLSENGQSFASIEKFETPQNFEIAMEKILSFLIGKNLESVMVGVPAVLEKITGLIRHASHLPEWNGKNIFNSLREKLNVPIFIENDAIFAGLGEAVKGAGKDHKIVVYLTISTGVGGGRIVDGKIDANAQGFEPGHQIIIPDGKEWSCGQRGCWEAYVSGTAWPKEKPLTDEYYQYLSQGLINIVMLLSPDIIVLGGSVSKDIDCDQVKSVLDQNLIIFKTPIIIKRVLGDEAGLYGGLLY